MRRQVISSGWRWEWQCVWVAIHLFTLPKTVEGYKRWINLGLVIAPVALALAVVIWR